MRAPDLGRKPASELRRINDILPPSGHLALGYQLRQHMRILGGVSTP